MTELLEKAIAQMKVLTDEQQDSIELILNKFNFYQNKLT